MVVSKKNKKSMQKIPKSLVLIAFVLVVTVAIYYRQAASIFRSMKPETVPAPVAVMDKPREVSATVSYEVPGDKVDHLRFVVTLDAAGMIEQIQTLDAETNEVPEKKKDFNSEVNVILKGKKLSELTAIDKVGQSSLTTWAFNDAIKDLQKQI